MKPRRISPAALAALFALFSALAAPAAENASPNRTFTLFMGSDLAVNRERGVQPVHDFIDGKLMVREQDAVVRVPVTPSVQFKISRALKLSESAVKVEGLSARQAYTLANDPGRKAIAAANAAGAAAQDADIAASRLIQAQNALIENAADTSLGAPALRPRIEQWVRDNTRASNTANMAASSELDNAGSTKDGVDFGNYDAMEIGFRVSSDRPLSSAYFVVIAQYRESHDKPGHVRNWIYAEDLGSLNEHPRRVFFKQGGFPLGFELLNHEVHFYQRGRELASNLAEKAVPLTFDEAHEYLVLDYLSANKGGTLAPSVAIGVGAKEFFPHFNEAQLQREIFVKVDQTGRPQGAFRDERCSQAAGDPFLDTLVSRVRFNPALKGGKAVDGVARLTIGGLTI